MLRDFENSVFIYIQVLTMLKFLAQLISLTRPLRTSPLNYSYELPFTRLFLKWCLNEAFVSE